MKNTNHLLVRPTLASPPSVCASRSGAIPCSPPGGSASLGIHTTYNIKVASASTTTARSITSLVTEIVNGKKEVIAVRPRRRQTNVN
jgi:hypothetical protein